MRWNALFAARRRARNSVYAALAGLLVVLGIASGARAQPADTTRAPAGVRSGSFTPAPFDSRSMGRPVADSLPARMPVVDLKQILEDEPGTFLYHLGPVAWPHGWSVQGLAPHRTRLWLDDLPYTDPVTGRPRFDLLPPAFVAGPTVGLDPGGHPAGVHTDWREMDRREALTEIRFRRDSNGLQNVEVFHSQQRRLSLLGTDGLLQGTFGFKGRATAGVYSGSDLERERGVWGRLRYRTENWVVELSDYSNRFRLNVHGGISPPGNRLSSIYLPEAFDDALFRGAGQNTIRNDLVARVRGPFLPRLQPATVSLGWTSNTYDYQTAYDGARVQGQTLSTPDTSWSVKTNGFHGAVTQPVQIGRHHLTLTARGTVRQRSGGTALADASPRSKAHLLLRDSLRLGAGGLLLAGGVHQTDAQSFPSARIELRQQIGPVGLRARASVDGQPLSWIATDGFAGFVVPVGDVPTGQVRRAELEASVEQGVFAASATGFLHQITDPVDLYSDATLGVDTVAARVADGSFLRGGATLSAGLRRNAGRGLYATGHVTALSFLNPNDSALHRRVADTLPSVFGRGRIGARFTIFRDLRTDLFVQARGWTEMNSRLFHPPTGRLVVPSQNEPIRGFPGERVGPSYTIDVQAQAVLMGAKLFFSFENVQSAQIIDPPSARPQVGTFISPLYPLPPLQFRFGVHWPLFD
jgi:hypothetical protein